MGKRLEQGKGNWECKVVICLERWDTISYRAFGIGDLWVRLEEGEGISNSDIWKKSVPVEETAGAKTLI